MKPEPLTQVDFHGTDRSRWIDRVNRVVLDSINIAYFGVVFRLEKEMFWSRHTIIYSLLTFDSIGPVWQLLRVPRLKLHKTNEYSNCKKNMVKSIVSLGARETSSAGLCRREALQSLYYRITMIHESPTSFNFEFSLRISVLGLPEHK